MRSLRKAWGSWRVDLRGVDAVEFLGAGYRGFVLGGGGVMLFGSLGLIGYQGKWAYY